MSSLATPTGRRPRRHGLSCALLGAIACAALGGATAALAASGEIAGAEGVFQVPGAQCDQLRDLSDGAVDNGVAVDGDIIVVCDGVDDGERRACQVISGFTTPGPSAGQGVGFCADRFPNGVQVIERGPLKTDVVVRATSFGAITGTSKTEYIEDDGSFTVHTDTVCETAAADSEGPGRKVCRRVLDDGQTPEVCTGDGVIVTPASAAANTQACEIIAEQLGNSVTEIDPTNLAFALFIDIDRLGKDASEALFVCPGHRLACPTTEASSLEDVIVDYQIPKVIVQEEPDCIMIRGRRLCPKPPG